MNQAWISFCFWLSSQSNFDLFYMQKLFWSVPTRAGNIWWRVWLIPISIAYQILVSDILECDLSSYDSISGSPCITKGWSAGGDYPVRAYLIGGSSATVSWPVVSIISGVLGLNGIFWLKILGLGSGSWLVLGLRFHYGLSLCKSNPSWMWTWPYALWILEDVVVTFFGRSFGLGTSGSGWHFKIACSIVFIKSRQVLTQPLFLWTYRARYG